MADVGTLECEELLAMDAPPVIEVRGNRPVGFVARHRFRELERFEASSTGYLRNAQWGTAAGPGFSGVNFGTRAASLLISPDFFGPTSACSRTSLRVSTGTISIFP